MRLSFFVFLALAGFHSALFAAELPAFTVETGEIAGAKFTAAVPTQWNGRLLLLAHGLRGEDQPLTALLFTERNPTKTLLEHGWMVAITSYRRNGVIIRRAITDLESLRVHLAQKHGEPDRTYLMGDSMGGLIVTLIMEQFPDKYAGAIAVGAALHMEESVPTVSLTHFPQRPILYLTNQSELIGPYRYIQSVPKNAVEPILWVVARDGHVNVNAGERLLALGALQQWVEDGKVPPPERNATLVPRPGPSQITFNPDGSATGRVTFVHPLFGTFIANFQPADLAQLGVKPGDKFQLVGFDGRLIKILYRETTDEDAPRGLLCSPEPEGFVAFGLQGGNAAADAKLKLGDPVTLRPLKTAK